MAFLIPSAQNHPPVSQASPSRAVFLPLALSLALSLAIPATRGPHSAVGAELQWRPAESLRLEGQGFDDTAAPYDRLPARAEKSVRGAVWSLSRHSAGLCARFVTDATEIHARWKLTSSNLAMNHMAATGVSGLDLYVRDEAGRWRWLAVGRPTAQENTARLVAGLPPGRREYLLYLPLYNGVSEVAVGVAADRELAPGPPRAAASQRPIVFYGTSITQGGCASRPGMVHTAILGRWLDRPVINLGFSGNGQMEAEVAALMGEIDAAVFVLDCLPNIDAAQVAERTGPVVRALRAARPKTPILLVEDRSYSDAFLLPSKAKRNASSRAALRQEYQKLLDDGVVDLHYLAGADLLGGDNEGTVDSSHPTDLGFFRQAEAFLKPLASILGQ